MVLVPSSGKIINVIIIWYLVVFHSICKIKIQVKIHNILYVNMNNIVINIWFHVPLHCNYHIRFQVSII